MTNPYQPSALVEEKPDELPSLQRPMGVSILSVLHACGGLYMAALGAFLFTHPDDRSPLLHWLVVGITPILTCLGFATALGLWRGKKWAWWLATFYYFQFAVGGIFVLAGVALASTAGKTLSERQMQLAIKHFTELLVFGTLTYYMTRKTVLRHFQFQRLTPSAPEASPYAKPAVNPAFPSVARSE